MSPELPSSKSDRRLRRLGALVFVAVVGVYANHFANPFQFDDSHVIVTNTAIRHLSRAWTYFTDGRTLSSLPSNQSYRPGVTLLNALDTAIGGGEPQPVAFHISIFFSFLVLGWLLFLFFRKALDAAQPHRWNELVALGGTAFFMLHTANAETINYVSARTDSLSTLCVVAGLVWWIYRPAHRRLGLYLLPVLVGFTAKETTVVFAPLLFMWELMLAPDAGETLRARLTTATRRSLPAFGACIAGAVLVTVLRPPTWIPGGTDRWLYLATQPYVILHYVQNFVLPITLSADTDWDLVHALSDPRVAIGVSFVLVLVAVAFGSLRAKATRPLGLGILWFLVFLLPTSSVIPLAEVINDHRPFGPYIGLVLAVASLASLLLARHEKALVERPASRGAVIALVVAVLAAHGVGTVVRNRVWSSGISLWKDVTEKSPRNGRGHMNYAVALMGEGDWDGAYAALQKARELTPNYSYVFVNLGVVESARHNDIAADEAFRTALRLRADDPTSYFFYARWLTKLGRFQQAEDLVSRGLKISQGHSGLASLDGELRRLRGLLEGRPELRAALEASLASPGDESLLVALSQQWREAGDRSRAADAAREAARLAPSSPRAQAQLCQAALEVGAKAEALAAAARALQLAPGEAEASRCQATAQAMRVR
jgi:Flp pilus assembly protein TadD